MKHFVLVLLLLVGCQTLEDVGLVTQNPEIKEVVAHRIYDPVEKRFGTHLAITANKFTTKLDIILIAFDGQQLNYNKTVRRIYARPKVSDIIWGDTGWRLIVRASRGDIEDVKLYNINPPEKQKTAWKKHYMVHWAFQTSAWRKSKLKPQEKQKNLPI